MSDSTKSYLDLIAQRAAEAEARLITQENKSHLMPMRHPQPDFFIADLFDAASFSIDQASMEYPLFALKPRDTKTRKFQHNNTTITVRATELGIATIHDKDIWIYCVSKLMQALYEGQEISQLIHFTIYDYLVTTNRHTSGSDYGRAKEALDRLRSTTITVESDNEKIREAKGFGLIDYWSIEEHEGRMIRVSVRLPDWLFHSIANKEVLKISPDYFRIRKPIDRRVYELARKHCGHQVEWKVSLQILHKKSGSTANISEFRRAIKSLASSDDLPDYKVAFDVKSDMLIFKNRDAKALIKHLTKGSR